MIKILKNEDGALIILVLAVVGFVALVVWVVHHG